MPRLLLALIGRRRPSISDDLVYWALRAAEEGRNPADLCAAIGATIPMFCVWKSRYGTLTLEELRSVRQQEAARARLQWVALVAGAVLVLGGFLLLARLGKVPSTRDDDGMLISASEPTPADTVAAVYPTRSDEPAALLPASPAPNPAAAAAPRAVASEGPDRFAVQVAAMPDLQLAERLARTLAKAGYPSFVLPTIVKDSEVFRVRVGPFDSREAATEALTHLERDGYRGAWVAR